MARLRRSDCTAPGIHRVKRGRGFSYVDSDGARVSDPEILDRIKNLVIPPAWEDVWICPLSNGHIQATGTDNKGRRQYRYHDDWRTHRDREKFDHMIEFAQHLPKLRHFTTEDLVGPGLTQERVLGCIVRLLDLGFFRIGTEGYAEENQTYGLATMRKRHVSIDGRVILFDYTAKSGKRRMQHIVDEDVLDVVQRLKTRKNGGHELFAYKSGNRWVDIKSPDINAYIKEITSHDFTAKDFRTWNATVLAEVALSVSTHIDSKNGRKRAIARAYQEVAHYLGNTPAVARSSYVDPRVVDRFQSGITIAKAVENLDELDESPLSATHGQIEEALLDLLDAAPAVTLERALARSA